MKIYDLLSPSYDNAYSLGLFASLDDALRTVTVRDGVGGKPVSAEADDAETLDIYERIIGNFDACGDIGVRVATVERVKKYEGGGAWESKITIRKGWVK